MSLFENLVLLLAVAIVLLWMSRRFGMPYPAMLAGAGALLALAPAVPTINLDPHLALALFISPALVDSAFDFPLLAARRYFRPLVALVVVAVLLTTAAVALFGIYVGGLSLAAAVALGAIVAPPDAAAAIAVLRNVRMPRRSVTVLRGESLLNDATALLLFAAAVAFHDPRVSAVEVSARIALATPGGILLGILGALLLKKMMPCFSGTLASNLLQFVATFAAWIIAEHLRVSAVLSVVAFGMTLALATTKSTAPHDRLHTYAVWDTAVFVLNVIAFLLMGLQARTIIEGMDRQQLLFAASFAGGVVAVVIIVRMAWLVSYNRLASRFSVLRGDLEPAPFKHALLIGWCGMRGLITIACAFALPAAFPHRELIVLSAFAVVLGTLVLQGLSLAPLVRMLRLDGDDGVADELLLARKEMSSVALRVLERQSGRMAEHWRYAFQIVHPELSGGDDLLFEKRKLGLTAIAQQRSRLDELFVSGAVGHDTFLTLQEELDFAQLVLTSGDERRIAEA